MPGEHTGNVRRGTAAGERRRLISFRCPLSSLLPLNAGAAPPSLLPPLP